MIISRCHRQHFQSFCYRTDCTEIFVMPIIKNVESSVDESSLWPAQLILSLSLYLVLSQIVVCSECFAKRGRGQTFPALRRFAMNRLTSKLFKYLIKQSPVEFQTVTVQLEIVRLLSYEAIPKKVEKSFFNISWKSLYRHHQSMTFFKIILVVKILSVINLWILINIFLFALPPAYENSAIEPPFHLQKQLFTTC